MYTASPLAVAWAGLLCCAVSCESTDCTDEYRPVWVALQDVQGGQICDATVSVTTPTTSAGAVIYPPTNPCLYYYAGTGPDLLQEPEYRLDVAAPGYSSAAVDIRTERDECGHPIPRVVSGPATAVGGGMPTVTVTLQDE